MSGYTRMVPRAKTRVGEIELECICGTWIPYPDADPDEDARRPSVCPDCESEWWVMDPFAATRKNKKKRRP